MTFYNRKEEVLEIKLTPHGRYLLSRGEFTPIYYSFFDDDVIYDLEYVSSSYAEIQNDSEGRIKETPRVHCQTNFKETAVLARSVYAHDDKKLQNYFEREYALSSVLGNADYYSNNAPAWDFSFLKGQLSSSALYYTGSGPVFQIPQIEVSSSLYKPTIGTTSDYYPIPLFGDESLREITEYSDETFLEIRKDFILLEINEINSTFQKENFELELFETVEEIRYLESGEIIATETLIPLKVSGDYKTSTEYVDYFFDIDVDQEINEDILCKYKGVDTTKGLFLQNAFDCLVPMADEAAQDVDQYRTNVIPSDIGEVCEIEDE